MKVRNRWRGEQRAKVVEVIIRGGFTFLIEAVGEMGLCIDTNALLINP